MWPSRKNTALQMRQPWILLQAQLCDLGQVAWFSDASFLTCCCKN